jgi:hypothetical protein
LVSSKLIKRIVLDPLSAFLKPHAPTERRAREGLASLSS